MNDGFQLHHQLQADCTVLGDFPLCRLLLLEDANYPWFILVPRRNGVRELYELDENEQIEVLRESSILSRALVAAFAPDKLNLGALGNMVPQLHIHHIARYRSDPAWPQPVWGRGLPLAYTEVTRRALIERLERAGLATLEWCV